MEHRKPEGGLITVMITIAVLIIGASYGVLQEQEILLKQEQEQLINKQIQKGK